MTEQKITTNEKLLNKQLNLMKAHKGYGLSEGARRQYNIDNMTDDQVQAIYQIKMVRKKLKMTQEQLARELGIPKRTLERWEYGVHKIKRTKILELALKYIMNTYAVRTPLPGLSNVIREIQEEEKERYENSTDTDDESTEPTQNGDQSEGNHPTK